MELSEADGLLRIAVEDLDAEACSAVSLCTGVSPLPKQQTRGLASLLTIPGPERGGRAGPIPDEARRRRASSWREPE